MGLYDKHWSGEFHDRGGAVISAQNADFGLVGDDATDNTVALAALAAECASVGVPMHLPPGIYRFSTAQTWTDLPGIRGPGILKPTAALDGAVCITINMTDANSPPFVWDGPVLDGILTDGSTGVSFGPDDIIYRVRLYRGQITRFGGTDALGLLIGRAVDFKWISFTVNQCYANVDVNPSSTAFPTCLQFSGGNISVADTFGLKVRAAKLCKLDGAIVIESNGEDAVLIQPAVAGDVIQVIMADYWEEDNWLSLAGDPTTRATKYAIQVNGAAAAQDVQLRRGHHNGVTRVCNFDKVSRGVVDSPYRASVGNTVDYTIGAGSIVNFVNYNQSPFTDTYLGKNATGIKMLDGDIVVDMAWNSGSIAAGVIRSAGAAVGVIATLGVASLLGYKADVSVSVDQAGVEFWAYPSGGDALTFWERNPTGGAVNWGACTVRIRLRK